MDCKKKPPRRLGAEADDARAQTEMYRGEPVPGVIPKAENSTPDREDCHAPQALRQVLARRKHIKKHYDAETSSCLQRLRALHRLSVELHYLSCESGIGRPSRKPK